MATMSPGFASRLKRWLGNRVEDGPEAYGDELIRVNSREEEIAALDDAALDRAIADLRSNRGVGKAGPEFRIEFFAIVRELAHRVIGLRPFDEQMGAGLALATGAVIEMPTGEGKTLAAVAPAALAALSGGGVHVLTVNDYLSRRDATWMGPAYERLGLSVGVVQESSTFDERRRAYACDLTYLTAKEAGFDFLRNQLCLDRDRLLRRDAALAIVDEADSILVDEARVPLVIAGEVAGLSSGAELVAALAGRLEPEEDFDTDEYGHNLFLTQRGSERVETELDCGNLYAEGNLELLADLRNALHALHLLERDRDYIVRDGRVELVDDFTGRVAEKRQWPDGLQAAIEAKERLELGREGRILGTITMQHFLATYPKLSGMTATASPAWEEIGEFYDLPVVIVPPHRPCIRVDHDDFIFTHIEAKRLALVGEIRRVHTAGRPVLVGTASVAESEELAGDLEREGLVCRVLNAKNDEFEAAVIAEAGAPGALTISTNMAGRGTDIKLGGADEGRRDEVVALGGLYVIGTNRHESLRIDRQLRGRAGRQGDPGSTRFFVSLEDPLISRYGVGRLISARSLPERQDHPVDAPVLRLEIARAQRIIEGENLAVRRRLWEFSLVVESQRHHFHEWRQRLLIGEVDSGLQQRCASRWEQLKGTVPGAVLDGVAKRLTLVVMDRCWSDHLSELQRLRDGMHVVGYVGKDPVSEFTREAGEAFGDLMDEIQDEAGALFDELGIGPDGVDWAQHGLAGPSSTWTYQVNDQPFGSNAMRGLANRAGFAALGAIAAAPVLFIWGLVLHWKRRRLKAELARRED